MGSTGNSGGVKNLDKYANQYNVHLQHGGTAGSPSVVPKLVTDGFTSAEVQTMLDKIGEVYREFGLDPFNSQQQLVYTFTSGTELDDYMATGDYNNGVVRVNPNSTRLRDTNFSTIYHELGHSIVDQLSRQMFHSDLHSGQMAGRIVTEARNTLRVRFHTDSEYVSNYGRSNDNEMIAEAVRDYMVNHGNSTPMSQAIVYRLHKFIKKYL